MSRGNYVKLAKTNLCGGMRAMDVLSGRISMQDGCRIECEMGNSDITLLEMG